MEWKEVRLGDYIEIKNGVPFKSSQFITQGIPVIKIKNVKSNRIIFDDLSYVSAETASDKKCFFIRPNDILITLTGNRKEGSIDSWVGKASLFRHSGKFLLNQRVGAIRIKTDLLCENFLAYVLCSLDTQLYLIQHATSSGGQANISPQIIYDYHISIPSIKDQRRIANILSSLDRKIELNNKINAQLEEMAQTLFKHWFVDFGPFMDGKFVESELGMIPEGWRVETLDEVADINPKRTLKKGDNATYLDMKNMPTSGPFPSAWETREMNGGMKFMNGDTLMARITPCLENGKVAYVNFLKENEVAFGSTEYIVMTTKEGKCPEVLYFLCRYPDFVSYATKNMNGSSGRQRVSGETIGKYKIVIPPISVIDRVAPIFASVMNQIKGHGFENQKLASLRDTLLPKLMSGEINLEDYGGE